MRPVQKSKRNIPASFPFMPLLMWIVLVLFAGGKFWSNKIFAVIIIFSYDKIGSR